MKSTYRNRLLTTTLFVSASVLGTPAFAQDVQEPVTGEPAQAVDETAAPTPAEETAGREIVVTGSRIARPNLTSSSPIAVVTGEETVDKADITLDTFLNTLPQVNPAGTTTSNNPGNGGQSNINLRGLGSNRNLVLIDGRRPMSSGTDLSVDLNTIPQGLIERIDVITGGAGATYGADAIAGVVNIIMKDDFQGVDLRATYSNALKNFDAREYQVSGVLGANFDDGKGNVAVAAEFSSRENLGKLERDFAAQATSTTPTPPMARYVASGANAPSAAALNTVFGSYGYAPGSVNDASRVGFNNDGTLIGFGVFNTAQDVVNYRFDPEGNDAAAANQNFFPDFYSYNFDRTNLLVLPLKRKSFFVKGNYEIDPHADFFIQGGYTEYNSASGLAATPIGTRVECATGTNPLRAKSNFVNCGFSVTQLVIPRSNPFVPADLNILLDSRTGDDPALVGVGAAEPIKIAKRLLDTGLRLTATENRVLQGLAGLRGDIVDNWRYEVSYSWGRTTIETAASGNVNVQNAERLLEAADGGDSLCEGGFNPFGINPISAECVEFLNETGFTQTDFTLKVLQGFVTGDVVELPAGPLSVVLGGEQRRWRYDFDPGTLFGPIAGFNTATPDHGTNKFTDWFAEARIPILKDAQYAKELELGLSFRHSKSEFVDIQNGGEGGSSDNAYGVTVSWAPLDELRFRGSYQHSVRAPNFVELFSGGSSFPQYFDPCSINTNFRATAGAAGAAICQATGLSLAQTATYVQTPGSQAFIGITGNADLGPETGDTFTVGAVFQKWGFTGSIDYYNIKIKDTIFAPDTNMLIAACYGFHGVNPDLDGTSPYCTGINRTPDISSISIPEAIGGDGSYFQAVNQGVVKTSGVDVQLGYNLPTDWLTPGSKLSANLMVNYLINYKVEELPGVTLDYAGTVSYFGAGLGTSFPEWKGNLNLAWNVKPFTFESRIRYIDGMDNRLSVQFPGEEDLFTGTDGVIYVDLAVEADFKPLTLRVGLNNAFDKGPETYAPNVQSGTDPSLYDVIGRRAYVSARLRF
ncbi:TonB-dependent receptor [Sphingomonas sp. RB56-2]|uniref:TonB-dependent receptor n=1 Tax=Sphingomonas brevis TaxID=2908206 RepID=A0ABT0SAV5_9SPHN|nr:TonB-dependent receptor [Sphingomonas brevis]MCL6741260.1 TonB-dependent receptor [Sphingomonas brevis]